MSAISGGDIYRGSPGAAKLIVGEHRRVHGIQRHAAGTEPIGNLTHVLFAVGIVEMLACRKNFNRPSAAAHQAVQQARMETLFEIDVCRNCVQHCYSLSAESSF